MGSGLLLVFALLIISSTIYKIVELKHRGRSDDDFRHELEKELADRDDKAVALEERVRVLERIITENYNADSLSDEIDKLKERANER